MGRKNPAAVLLSNPEQERRVQTFSCCPPEQREGSAVLRIPRKVQIPRRSRFSGLNIFFFNPMLETCRHAQPITARRSQGIAREKSCKINQIQAIVQVLHVGLQAQAQIVFLVDVGA